MQRDKYRWLTGGQGLALVLLIALSTPVRGDYAPASQPNALLGEVFSFVGDFGQWNAKNNGMPLAFVEMMPAADEGAAFVFLFWLWLHDPQSTPGGPSLSSSSSNATSLAHITSPPFSPAAASVPVGSILLDQTQNTPPTLPSSGGTNVTSTSGNNTGPAITNDPTLAPPNNSVPSLASSVSSSVNSPPSSVPGGVGVSLPVLADNSGNPLGNGQSPAISKGGVSAPPSNGGSTGTEENGASIPLHSGGISAPTSGQSSNGNGSQPSLLNNGASAPPAYVPNLGSASVPILGNGSQPTLVSDPATTPLAGAIPPVSSLLPNDPPLLSGGNGTPPISGPMVDPSSSDPGLRPFTAVPEPNSMTLLILGGLGVCLSRWRHSRKPGNTIVTQRASVA